MSAERAQWLGEPRPSGNGAGPKLRLGGMALRNGLLIHGPTAWAAAARARDGRIEVASGPKPALSARAGSAPLLRGPLKLAESLAVVPLARRRVGAARLPFEDLRVMGAAAAAAGLSAALRRRRPVTFVREAAAAALGVVPAMVALHDSDLAAYHGVEHKAIGAYERGGSPADAAKEHERCGSHLIAPLVVLSVAAQLGLQRLSDEPGPAARGLAALLSVSAAVELFAWSERHPRSPVARGLRVPGTEIQRLLATREPTPEQLEVGSAALREILRVERAGSA